jgi:hypothetical protein
VANLNLTTDVWLNGLIVLKEELVQNTTQKWIKEICEKKDFCIHLTKREVFWWRTDQAYNRQDVDGVWTQIQGFPNKKGFLVLWAVADCDLNLEIDWDYLKGDAMMFNNNGGYAWQYNAIPHQGLNVTGDNVLNLDGSEYTMTTASIWFEGFAEDWKPNLGGTLAIANLDINTVSSEQPPFDLNCVAYNQYETRFSRHLDFGDCSFMQYDLTNDLQLAMDEIFTPKFQAACAGSDGTGARGLWAVFFQRIGAWCWGSNVWQDVSNPASAILDMSGFPEE